VRLLLILLLILWDSAGVVRVLITIERVKGSAHHPVLMWCTVRVVSRLDNYTPRISCVSSAKQSYTFIMSHEMDLVQERRDKKVCKRRVWEVVNVAVPPWQ